MSAFKKPLNWLEYDTGQTRGSILHTKPELVMIAIVIVAEEIPHLLESYRKIPTTSGVYDAEYEPSEKNSSDTELPIWTKTKFKVDEVDYEKRNIERRKRVQLVNSAWIV